MAIFIDASIFISYDNEKDVHHQKAVGIFLEIEKGKFGQCFTSDYILNEVVGVTFRKCGKERAVALGEHIMNTIFVLNVDDHILKESWKLFVNNHLQISLVDCSSVAVAKMTNTKFIATFDKEFKKLKDISIID
ncbi:MAG: PIN domain-containing protein [Nanoarchaeota archaeon]